MHSDTVNPQAEVESGPAGTRVALGQAPSSDSHFVDIVPHYWVEALPLLLAVHRGGDSQGQRLGVQHLAQMARVADLGVAAVSLLGELSEIVDDRRVVELLSRARAVSEASPDQRTGKGENPRSDRPRSARS